jgi:cytochrome c oxidase subunit 2
MSLLSKFLAIVAGCMSAFYSSAAFAAMQLNMVKGVTPVSLSQYDLHMIMLAVVTAIGVVVFGILIYSIVMHRKARGVKPAEFHENIHIEVIWTVIPFVILIVLAIPATRALIMGYDTRKADLTIAVTGYQWYWKYEYMGEDVSFTSHSTTTQEQINGLLPKSEHYLLEVDNVLVVPTHTKIRFTFTANDVLHAWWMPDLGIKKDTIPGFINESWAYIETPGVYRGQCAELCGIHHGFMPIVVEAKSPEEYQVWLSSQKSAKEKS